MTLLNTSFPILLLGLLVSSLYGAVFHLLRGGSLLRLFLYLLLAWLGFFAGQFTAEALGWDFLSVGSLHLGIATLGSFIFLLLGYWLSLVKPAPRPARRRR